ncbi:MAG: phosphatase PAP2 family protein [Flavobacteriaceae bacterium]|jgi:membrane-associated phospholipid phosphatase|nr:phosphatase PAP2 family protein [Flavobacteriaceae bacterium]
MNQIIINNYSKIKALLFLIPLVLLSIITLFLYFENCLSINGYVRIQKSTFLFINHFVGGYPTLLFNLTQVGDALVFTSFISILFVYCPKLWESLITGSLFSLLFTAVLKNFFAVPRPAAMFDNHTFNIIGERLAASNSFPSGHSITVFTFITVLMFAFMPKQLKYRIGFYIFAILIGLLFAFTRVAVGAHYPLDVIVGCLVGYICGLLGTLISKKYEIWTWIYKRKYYPLFLVLFIICSILLVQRIMERGLIIHYLSLISLIITLYKITSVYVEKRD